MELLVFVLSAAMIVGGALGVVLNSNTVRAALSLVLVLFGIAVMFVSLNAHFLAAVQVIVYAGAIVVLFLFVIMLLGVDRDENLSIEPFPVQRPLAVIVGVGFVGLVVATLVQARDTLVEAGAETPEAESNVREIALRLFGDYVFAFEFTSVLLIVAVVGTVMMTRSSRREYATTDSGGAER